MLLLPLSAALLCLSALVSAAKNYSVYYQDPLFSWFGTWTNITGTLDADGGHRLTTQAGSFASITYTFASVYFVSALWPYQVATNYAIDGNPPITVDMQDHSVPTTDGGTAIVTAAVVGSWTSNANQEHTVTVTIPVGGSYAIVDVFIFEVLDPSDTSSTSSSTSTGSSTGTTSSSTSSSSSTSTSSSPSSPSASSSSSSSGSLSNKVRGLIISMAVVGTALALVLLLFLWRFCIRRKDANGNDSQMSPIMPHYDPLPPSHIITPFTGLVDGADQNNNAIVFTTEGRNGANVPLDGSLPYYDNATSYYGGMQSDNLQRPPNDPNVSSSTFYTNQATSSIPLIPLHTHSIHHDLQRHYSTPSMMNDSPPMYTRDTTPNISGRHDTSSLLDDSTAISSSSWSNEKTRNYRPSSRISPNIPGADIGSDALIPTAIPEKNEESDGAWDGR